ncbi:hypothetical protein [Streptomyces sp. NPDC057966]|uniref:hypothetical protein n=1 Tax=Streptomyces sp. NPDC057966 TaxID=3346292 RepID=UPI0036EEBE03
MRYTKASNDVVRHPRLNSDAKLLVIYVQGLPDDVARNPLGELAGKVGIKGRVYQKAKRQLVAHGYLHEWRSQGEGGRWQTEQLLTNVPLTGEQAAPLRTAQPLVVSVDPPVTPSPSEQFPTVGAPTARTVGGYEPVEDHSDKTTPHPPTEPEREHEPEREREHAPEREPEPEPEPRSESEPAAVPAPAPPPQAAVAADPAQLARAERVLLSLRHTRRELHLGVREARGLAVEAVKWLERGLSESDLRHALLAERPQDGVRSAVGFLRYRLIQKLPEPLVRQQPPERPPLPEPVECAGPGDPHVFRPLLGESECPSCRLAAARSEAVPEPVPWRERVARLNAAPTALPAET